MLNPTGKSNSFLPTLHSALFPLKHTNNPPAGNLKGKAAFPAGVCSLVMIIWAYYRLPEFKGRTYEELDLMFARRLPAREFSKCVVLVDREGNSYRKGSGSGDLSEKKE